MKLVVGLGNPGKEYSRTRHNIGAVLVEEWAVPKGASFTQKKFASRWGQVEWQGEKVLLLLPETFMNRSGEAVGEAVRFYGLSPDQMIVAHDDLDFVLGRAKADFDAGAAGHKGVLSIIERIGTRRFARIRMGIGKPERKEEVEEFVLSPFTADELETVGRMKQAGLALLDRWIQGGLNDTRL